MPIDPDSLEALTAGLPPPIAVIVLLALMLNLVFGDADMDTRAHYHPRAIIARIVDQLERRYRKSHFTEKMLVAEGTSFAVVLLLLAGLAGACVLAVRLFVPFGWLLEVFVVAMMMTLRQSLTELRGLALALERSEAEARARLQMLVARDVDDMSHKQIAGAAVDHASRVLVICLVGPVLWFLVFQTPGLLLFSTAAVMARLLDNRLNEHRAFGRFPVKVFSLMMWPVSLVTGFLALVILPLLTVPGWLRYLKIITGGPMLRDWRVLPRAVMAAALNVQLGGQVVVEGRALSTPVVGIGNRFIAASDIVRSTTVINRMTAVVCLIFLTWGALQLWGMPATSPHI